MSDTSNLVRLAGPVHDRLRIAASARGQTVEALVGTLVDGFLAGEGRAAPALGEVITRLRQHAETLSRRGIAALWVFGSVARGDARPDSDVDLLAEFGPGASKTLIGLASLRAEITEMLGVHADLVDRAAMHGAVRSAAERDAVRVI